MVIVLVAGLIGVSLYLAKRLSEANTANTALRSQVASLKRQLKSSRR
jgi:Tfp pilus assembly protein PilN